MGKIYFLCGAVGSGKTTFSRQLAEAENAFCFSIDEWMIPLFGEHMERNVFDNHLTTLMELFKSSSERLVKLGIPIIFDCGFWSKDQRSEFRSWVKSIGAEMRMYYIKSSYETCCERALNRNGDMSTAHYEVNREMLALFWAKFQAPTDDEEFILVENDG